MQHARRNRSKCKSHTPVEDGWDETPDYRLCNEDVDLEQYENSTYNHDDKKEN